ncbi:Isochorismatase-like protein [Pyronema omphalodes]|nr:Isochorismatase-like protein [Pyronema omphalodes]
MALSFRQHLGIPASQPTTSDSVLLLIDVQNEYDHGKLAIKNFSASVNKIHELLERYRSAGGSIIHIYHDTPEGAPLFTPGTELAEPYALTAPKDGETVLHKPAPISFTGTNLDELIKATGKNKLVLTGYMAHVCVSGTARVAFEKGYDVTVVSDAIGDRDIPGVEAEKLVEVVLAEVGDAFATIVKAEEIN